MREEKLYSTKEYLDKIRDEELDRIFDQAVREAKQRQLDEMAREEKEEEFAQLVVKLCDYETEIDSLQDYIIQHELAHDREKETIAKWKKELTQIKRQYSITKNKIERFIKDENYIRDYKIKQ